MEARGQGCRVDQPLDPTWKQCHTDHPKPTDTMMRGPVKATVQAATPEAHDAEASQMFTGRQAR